MRRWHDIGTHGNRLSYSASRSAGSAVIHRKRFRLVGHVAADFQPGTTQNDEQIQELTKRAASTSSQLPSGPSYEAAAEPLAPQWSTQQLVQKAHKLRSVEQVRRFLLAHGQQLDANSLTQLYIRLRHIYLHNPPQQCTSQTPQAYSTQPATEDEPPLEADIIKPTFAVKLTPHEAELATWHQLQAVTRRLSPELNTSQWALISYTLAKSNQPQTSILNLIVAHTSFDLQTLSPDALVNIIWSLAELQHHPDHEWLQCFLLASKPQLPSFKPALLVNLLWALGKLQVQPDDIWMQALMLALHPQLPFLSPSQLVTTSWALAELAYLPSLHWMHSYSQAATAQLPKFKPHHIASLLPCLLQLQYMPSKLLQSAIRQQVIDTLPAFKSRQLSLVLWALGKMGARAPPYWLDLVSEQLQLLLRRSSVADIAAVVWALPRLAHPRARDLGLRRSRLLRDVARVSELRLDGCSAAELVQLVEGFARLGYYPGVGWIASHETACAGMGAALGEENRRKIRAAYDRIWSD